MQCSTISLTYQYSPTSLHLGYCSIALQMLTAWGLTLNFEDLGRRGSLACKENLQRCKDSGVECCTSHIFSDTTSWKSEVENRLLSESFIWVATPPSESSCGKSRRFWTSNCIPRRSVASIPRNERQRPLATEIVMGIHRSAGNLMKASKEPNVETLELSKLWKLVGLERLAVGNACLNNDSVASWSLITSFSCFPNWQSLSWDLISWF